MPENTKEIKTRINATKKTMQITSAMNMVSSSKMRSAEKATRDFSQYMEQIEDIVANLLGSSLDFNLSVLKERNKINSVLAIVISSDRGLAGGYNANIIKQLKEDISQDHGIAYKVLAVGNKAYGACKNIEDCTLLDEGYPSRDDIDLVDVQSIAVKAIKMYTDLEVDKVVIYYNHYVNTLTQNVTKLTLLPIEKKETKASKIYELEQSLDATLDIVLPIYFENIIYGTMLDAKASEHASRMTAMQSATDNAKEVIEQLNLMYNRARQSQITNELTDIIGGANALN